MTKKQLDELNDKLDKLLSKRYVFMRGVIRGVGIAIGTTIVAAIVFSILAVVVDTVDDVPIIRDIVGPFQSENLRR